jgi:hypothetical protein
VSIGDSGGLAHGEAADSLEALELYRLVNSKESVSCKLISQLRLTNFYILT